MSRIAGYCGVCGTLCETEQVLNAHHYGDCGKCGRMEELFSFPRPTYCESCGQSIGAVAKAVAAERERCAKVADGFVGDVAGASYIADAIRKGM